MAKVIPLAAARPAAAPAVVNEREERKEQRKAYRLWFDDRKALILSLIEAAPWKREPLPDPASRLNVADMGLDRVAVQRTIVALTPAEAATWSERFDQLRDRRAALLERYGADREPRTLWLPLFIEQPRAVVYQYNEAYVSFGAASVGTLSCEYFDPEAKKVVKETLDVAAYCAERSWPRENVTIRRASGHQYVVRVRWHDRNEELRSRADCVVLVLDEPKEAAQIVDTYRPRNATRADKRTPADSWRSFEFVHYPDGRPAKGKSKA